MSIYRSPGQGLEMSPIIGPETPKLWCRLFGHSLMGEYRDAKGLFHTPDGTREFPSNIIPPKYFTRVWCVTCGLEWQRQP
jgi:hypothetical protein